MIGLHLVHGDVVFASRVINWAGVVVILVYDYKLQRIGVPQGAHRREGSQLCVLPEELPT